jgi:pyruvate dehydrogenase E1 component
MNDFRDADPRDTQGWLESFDAVIQGDGPERGRYLLDRLVERATTCGLARPFSANTPYVNTIPLDRQPAYPGDLDLERRIRAIARWNAMAMVVRANRAFPGLGGHISTYASCASLYDVGFHHFFRAGSDDTAGDQIFFQGHASPGIYARAYLEGRIDASRLHRFRRETNGGGLSSYPHPWLMPDFWEFPTVSMGLSPIASIYQARFNRYLRDRGIRDTDGSRVWAFLGDGETDEPESLGAITLASREHLDNLTWVINCNLQRLDGPVRGNGKIIQELEAIFRGAGWTVIKVIWGDDWDPLLARDDSGLLVKRMGEVPDGQYQKYSVSSGDFIRKDFFGKYPETLALVTDLTDAKLAKMRRGGHDSHKIHAAYRAAVDNRDAPTVILAKTIKGYGLGEAGEGRNVTHQQKKLNEKELREFRDRFGIPISDSEIDETPFYRPAADSIEIEYLLERRRALGGPIPHRRVRAKPLPGIPSSLFREFKEDTGEREAATTMVTVRLLQRLMSDREIGPLIVPIVPDEARTFGMDALFRKFGIYSRVGQTYEPADSDVVLYYREALDGQLIEEGITEAGAMSSFIAAGSAYATHGVNTIPFFFFYSMFGFQRIGDLIWQNADSRGRGFLIGATAGRTTLAGEGLQHQDGQSHILASTIPTLCSYDPAFSFEIAVIVEHALRRMYVDGEPCFYYLTVENEMYPMPAMPEGVEDGIRRGMYRFRRADGDGDADVNLMASGPIVREALAAQQLLAERGVRADVWSVTSFSELRRDAMAVERWNMLHPTAPPRSSFLAEALGPAPAPVVAASDYMRIVADQIARYVPADFSSLGTDGFGRSDTREALRRFFEVDAAAIAVAALYQLSRAGKVAPEKVEQAIRDLEIDPDQPDPTTV